jgi:hypothetical protein
MTEALLHRHGQAVHAHPHAGPHRHLRLPWRSASVAGHVPRAQASAAVVAAGLQVADPLIGLAITLVILRISRQSWLTVSGADHHHH